jgi:hypothetical protein
MESLSGFEYDGAGLRCATASEIINHRFKHLVEDAQTDYYGVLPASGNVGDHA